MAKFKVTASLPFLDRDKYLADFQEAINQAVIKAARKFLLAAVPLVPVFTGFARGAFGNLEDVAGRVDGGRIKGTRGGRTKEKFYKARNYYYYPPGGGRVLRSNISGRPYATPASDIIGKGRLTSATTGTRVLFKFAIDITYFNALDQEKWHAFDAGRKAFNAEFKAQFDALKPKIGKYFVRREVR